MAKKLDMVNTEGKTSQKKNPFISEDKEVVSKSMRIYEKDFNMVREMAFKDGKKMVEVIEEAIDLLYKSKNYDK